MQCYGALPMGNIKEAVVRILSRDDVVASLDMSECIKAMAGAMAAVSSGNTVMADKHIIEQEGNKGFLGAMLGSCSSPDTLGLKIVTVKPNNPRAGLPVLQGAMLLFDAVSGVPSGLIDAASVTAIRTSAVSAVATQLLSRDDAHVVALLGTGVQAAAHLDAMLAVRPIERFIVWGRSESKALEFCKEHSNRLGVPVEHEISAQSAASMADIVCTTTGTDVPIIFGGWVRPGTHINLIGAHDASHREADEVLISMSKVYTDYTEFSLKSAGDIVIAINLGAISPTDIIGELGDIVNGVIPGRSNDEDVTVFKSIGLIAQDLVAGELALKNAAANDIGLVCNF